jgi:phospholipid/cholesterol/gamma-HCH transport system ATP-binding protein
VSNALIQFRGLKKRFGEQVVLDGIDLDVARGETVALMGPSGVGKTVFIKTLVGLMRPDEGTVIFDGLDVTRSDERELAPVRRRIGFVFQASALFDSLSVGDNVAYPLRVGAPLAPEAIQARVAECLELVGLGGTESLAPAQLSGGMRKRVAIARALATRPEVLLYDEPTVGLDPANVQRIAALIDEIHRRVGATGIVVSHDETLVFAVADRLALLIAAHLAWMGPIEEARSHPPEILTAFLRGAPLGGTT